ncbi:MAG: N-6 DNA methylase [Candidatus Freyarchaeota archaeon]|nr:N-6 DNA methylase [Candidatus Jordarchaeia archaeon]MBS7267230.1 N-6 DNA methylase [Candidatus Jordarchaeia archaeon]MBS7278445.1 N-6 DNA methylase [Candidatus Jordarchaeia archaeon]
MMQSRILKKLGVEPAIYESFQILISSLSTILGYCGDEHLESLKTWNSPITQNLNKLDPDEIEFIESELSGATIPINECQIRVQKLIPNDERKKFAAYYTIDQGTRFMESVAYEYLKIYEKQRVVLADPFLGSGRTLTAAINKIGSKKVEAVWGVEPLVLPALVAYASLLKVMGGEKDNVKVIAGDTFKEVPKAFSPFTHFGLPKVDIILTNPPFTRWKYLEKGYRDYLLKVICELGYEGFLTRREVSLQILSMFLSDYILINGGLLVSVLPASTFYTIYGRGYKSLIKKSYEILGLVELASRPSFSEDCGFKEVIIVAVKNGNRSRQTLFTELNNNCEERAKDIIFGQKIEGINAFNIHGLPRFMDINWLALFGKNKLRDIIANIFEQGLKKGKLDYWENVLGRGSIIRGVEMYGPEFFFIPNKHWSISREDEDAVEIENKENKSKLILGKEFLTRTLRKPSLYSNVIEANVESYMLTVPQKELQELPGDLKNYIEWGINSRTANPAIKAYGKYWFSHVHKQMATKRPFGQVFIPDKVDLSFSRRGVFANYTREKTAASKNFYITKDENQTIAKLLVGWFNSTLFISTLILLGRKISETWTRFLENDYLELPIINVNSTDKESTLEVCRKVDNLISKPLPPLWNQMHKEYRYLLDLSIAEATKLDKPEKIVEDLHQTLTTYLQ